MSTMPNASELTAREQIPQLRTNRSANTERPARLMRIADRVGSRYESMLNNIGWQSGSSEHRTIALTSCKPRDGVSTIAAQMAISAALRFEARVLLIDCNKQHPSVHVPFKASPTMGLGNALRTGEIQNSIHETAIVDLHIMPIGDRAGISSCASQFESMLKSASSDYDLVILDMPAISRSALAMKWFSFVDTVLLVLRNKTPAVLATRAKRSLENVGANLQGVIHNRG